MTPREKAAELIVKYQITAKELSYNGAIECALIAVDEILNTNALIDEDVYAETPAYAQYWKEVKQEINNL